mmetsp:Transcript_3926/g.10801  ORF Transcript_3926/g.10801 Transcript_3926/m.10801 type:complete len:326 (-) Transcript_3926:1386-2363(-)
MINACVCVCVCVSERERARERERERENKLWWSKVFLVNHDSAVALGRARGGGELVLVLDSDKLGDVLKLSSDGGHAAVEDADERTVVRAGRVRAVDRGGQDLMPPRATRLELMLRDAALIRACPERRRRHHLVVRAARRVQLQRVVRRYLSRGLGQAIHHPAHAAHAFVHPNRADRVVRGQQALALCFFSRAGHFGRRTRRGVENEHYSDHVQNEVHAERQQVPDGRRIVVVDQHIKREHKRCNRAGEDQHLQHKDKADEVAHPVRDQRQRNLEPKHWHDEPRGDDLRDLSGTPLLTDPKRQHKRFQNRRAREERDIAGQRLEPR